MSAIAEKVVRPRRRRLRRGHRRLVRHRDRGRRRGRRRAARADRSRAEHPRRALDRELHLPPAGQADLRVGRALSRAGRLGVAAASLRPSHRCASPRRFLGERCLDARTCLRHRGRMVPC